MVTGVKGEATSPSVAREAPQSAFPPNPSHRFVLLRACGGSGPVAFGVRTDLDRLGYQALSRKRSSAL